MHQEQSFEKGVSHTSVEVCHRTSAYQLLYPCILVRSRRDFVEKIKRKMMTTANRTE